MSDPDDRAQDVDDQFRALMEGLRTTIPGVMVLFSFLLVLPFQSSFLDLSSLNAVVFYVAFICSAVAAVLLIAPSVHQRVRAPMSGIRRRTMSHVMTATKLAIVGTVFFMVAVIAVVYLATALVADDVIAAIASALVAGVATWAWFYLPLVSFESSN